jgi:hypothetical protein
MTPQTSLRAALADPRLLGSVLGGDSWASWRALLLAAMGEALKPDELGIFRKLTNREQPPTARVDELVAVVGRRGGKSSAISALACYIAALCKHDKLVPGERGVVLCVAPDQRQAKIVLDYTSGILEGSPLFARMITRRTSDTIELENKCAIEVRSAQFRRLRGMTAIACIADEACFWRSEDSTNLDSEILNAVRPALATTGGPLIVISSPYSRKGVVWEAFRKHFGNDNDPGILIAKGTTADLNPSIDPKVIARALERDEASARAEYLAEFRSDLEGFVDLDAVKACVSDGVRERPPETRNIYVGFVDPSGGSVDSFTLAIGHREGKTCVIDCVREIRPPFSPEMATAELCSVLRSYKCSTVFGDKFGGLWPAEQFRNHGVFYEPAERSKSELYVDLLPALNSRTIDLVDSDRLVQQIVGLERRVGRGGRDSIDHGPGGHDDLANVVAGVLGVIDRRSSSDFYKPLEYRPQSIW